MGKKNDLGSFLVADFGFGYFMDPFFKSLVVDIFTFNASSSVKNRLFVVGAMGFLYF